MDIKSWVSKDDSNLKMSNFYLTKSKLKFNLHYIWMMYEESNYKYWKDFRFSVDSDYSFFITLLPLSNDLIKNYG